MVGFPTEPMAGVYTIEHVTRATHRVMDGAAAYLSTTNDFQRYYSSKEKMRPSSSFLCAPQSVIQRTVLAKRALREEFSYLPQV